MKKIVICLLLALMLISFSACANNPQEVSEPPSSTDVPNTSISEPDITESNDTNSGNSKIQNEAQTVKMMVGENELYITIYDNLTSRDFLSKLPLTLTFEDITQPKRSAICLKHLLRKMLPTALIPMSEMWHCMLLGEIYRSFIRISGIQQGLFLSVILMRALKSLRK